MQYILEFKEDGQTSAVSSEAPSIVLVSPKNIIQVQIWKVAAEGAVSFFLAQIKEIDSLSDVRLRLQP
jgi:hypothetical protein